MEEITSPFTVVIWPFLEDPTERARFYQIACEMALVVSTHLTADSSQTEGEEIGNMEDQLVA